jgi:hypothetical protein
MMDTRVKPAYDECKCRCAVHHIHSCHHQRKRVIQYAAAAPWVARSSRAMTLQSIHFSNSQRASNHNGGKTQLRSLAACFLREVLPET